VAAASTRGELAAHDSFDPVQLVTEVQVRWRRGVPVLAVHGLLNLSGATAILTAVEEQTHAGARSVVCDLTELDGVSDERLLTVFAAAQRRLGPWPEHALHLAGASPAVHHLLTRLAIDRFLSLYDTVDAALRIAQSEWGATYRELSLIPDEHSPALARGCLATLPPVGSTPWRDEAAVVVSELATNAVRHSRAAFTFALARRPTQLLIGVTDPSRQEPIMRPVHPGAFGGRGMQLVDALSDSWGVRLIHEGGKTVWARMSLVPPSPSNP
jgi:hypothetical protein